MWMKNMVKIFFDTDVCLDFLAFRQPFHEKMDKVIGYAAMNEQRCMISECCIPNLIYILSNTYNVDNFEKRLMNWIEGRDIISTDKSVILKAIQSPFSDKEDACQYYTALYNNIDY